MIAEELVTLLGVELSPGAKEKLQAFDKGLDAVVSRVKQASVVLTAAAGGMALYFSNAVNGAADLQRLSDTTGLRRERDGGIRLRRAVRPCEDGEAGPLDGQDAGELRQPIQGDGCGHGEYLGGCLRALP